MSPEFAEALEAYDRLLAVTRDRIAKLEEVVGATERVIRPEKREESK